MAVDIQDNPLYHVFALLSLSVGLSLEIRPMSVSLSLYLTSVCLINIDGRADKIKYNRYLKVQSRERQRQRQTERVAERRREIESESGERETGRQRQIYKERRRETIIDPSFLKYIHKSCKILIQMNLVSNNRGSGCLRQ